VEAGSDKASPPEIIGVIAKRAKTASVAAAKAKLRRRERLELGIYREPSLSNY
jgi:hypothetical protein